MLLKWIKDLILVVLIATFINIFLFILNDQRSIIGTWEIQYENIENLPGNHYDIIKIKSDKTFEHLTNQVEKQGQYSVNDTQLTLFYDDETIVIYLIQIDIKTIENINNGYLYKKITRIE